MKKIFTTMLAVAAFAGTVSAQSFNNVAATASWAVGNEIR